MQEIDVRDLAYTAARNLVGIKILSGKEKILLKTSCFNARNWCSQAGANCDAKFVWTKMLSEKENNCIKDILLLVQEIDVRNLEQNVRRNLVGTKLLKDKEEIELKTSCSYSKKFIFAIWWKLRREIWFV